MTSEGFAPVLLLAKLVHAAQLIVAQAVVVVLIAPLRALPPAD
jgi:hypothetical protein